MLTLSTLKFYPRAWRIGTMKAVGRRRRGGPGAGDRRRRARYHHGNLRRALLDAALALVEREGADALTLRAAARRAGVVRNGDPEELALCAWSATHGRSALAVDGQLDKSARGLGEFAQAVIGNVFLGLGRR